MNLPSYSLIRGLVKTSYLVRALKADEDLENREDPKDFPRNLQDYSYLCYEYPEDKRSKLYIPFLENVEIRESQGANLQAYDLVGRNSNLFLYKSSPSRKFSVSFRIIYPHVDAIINGQAQSGPFHERFKNARITGRYGDDEVANCILGWLEIIKTSTKNNSKNPSYGPPIIRLNHGAHYKNIPCVATNYTIGYDNTNGNTYQIFTNSGGDRLGLNILQNPFTLNILHRAITVTLELSEVRVGNFGEFRPEVNIYGDNNTGWEAVFEYGTMDPNNARI